MTFSGEISLDRACLSGLFQNSLFHFVFLCFAFLFYAFYFSVLLRSRLQFNTFIFDRHLMQRRSAVKPFKSQNSKKLCFPVAQLAHFLSLWFLWYMGYISNSEKLVFKKLCWVTLILSLTLFLPETDGNLLQLLGNVTFPQGLNC